MLTSVSLPDPRKIGASYLDHGFWQINAARASKLCQPHGLPRHGFYRVVLFDGFYCEVHRTLVTRDGRAKQVWAIRTSAHRANP
jgi:hypothetical protein